ncbi:armadillo-type protein [Mycena sanguinolenta]|nr:armadillo-type protein [Mycena sanguinolenta]
MATPHEFECHSVHSWWSDSNSLGATIPLHTFAKPLAKFLHHRQVTALLAKNRDSPLSAELLDLLTVYLESKEISVATKTRILHELEIRAATEADANVIVKNNGLPALIFLLSSRDPNILGIVCNIFATLAVWSYLDAEGLSSYLFERMVYLSMHENPSVHRHSLNALGGFITLSEEAAQAIANAGILNIATTLLLHEDPNTLKQTCDILNNLSRYDSCKVILAGSVQNQFLNALVDLGAQFQNSVMAFLLSISAGSLSSAQAFATEFNLKWIREKLDWPSTSFLNFACRILGNIAQHDLLVEPIVQLAPCHRLVALLLHSEPDVATQAAYALSQICRVDAGMYSFSTALLDLLGSADDMLVASSCRLLGSLAQSEALNTAIARSSCCQYLVSLIGKSIFWDEPEWLDTLLKICSYPPGARAVAAAMIEPLSSPESFAPTILAQHCRVLVSLSRHLEADVASQAIHALSQICLVDIGMYSVFNVLAELLGSADDVVVASGCRLLGKLAQTEVLNTAIAKSAFCQHLVSLIGTSILQNKLPFTLSEISGHLPGAHAVANAMNEALSSPWLLAPTVLADHCCTLGYVASSSYEVANSVNFTPLLLLLWGEDLVVRSQYLVVRAQAIKMFRCILRGLSAQPVTSLRRAKTR